jgi:hypothetical protein
VARRQFDLLINKHPPKLYRAGSQQNITPPPNLHNHHNHL